MENRSKAVILTGRYMIWNRQDAPGWSEAVFYLRNYRPRQHVAGKEYLSTAGFPPSAVREVWEERFKKVVSLVELPKPL